MRRRLGGIAAAAACVLSGCLLGPHGLAAPSVPVFAGAVRLPGSDGGTEPRVTVTPDGRRWVVSNHNGTAVVYESTDGVHWSKTATDPSDQQLPSIDVDIVSTRTGRLIAVELDFVAISLITSYSDDGGRTWTPTASFPLAPPLNGTQLADQDRPWLAVGPDDPGTHQPRVYLLFHNLLSGAATHQMWVVTSTDGGATWGLPTPTTLPGSQAWLDLQCADSGGPSNIVVNQTTGQVYAVFGTRSSVLGGCGASVTGPFEINVVAATRVWVATAPADGTTNAGQWTQSLAVDDSASNHIVGMQLAPGAVDKAGNVYVFYPESPNAYPDYDGAALRYVHASADLSAWSAPVTVAPSGGAGHLLPHIVAGDPGKLDFAYFSGETQATGEPLWYATAAQTLDGLSATPHIEETRLSPVATYQWTGSHMMGACGSGPAAGVQNGFECSRSTDVWGIALDAQCRAVVTWPVQSNGSDGATPNAHDTEGTYVAVQTSGPALCTPSGAVQAAATGSPLPSGGVVVEQSPSPSPTPPLPNTARAVGIAGGGAGFGFGAGVVALGGVAGWLARRRRHRRRGPG